MSGDNRMIAITTPKISVGFFRGRAIPKISDIIVKACDLCAKLHFFAHTSKWMNMEKGVVTVIYF